LSAFHISLTILGGYIDFLQKAVKQNRSEGNFNTMIAFLVTIKT